MNTTNTLAKTLLEADVEQLEKALEAKRLVSSLEVLCNGANGHNGSVAVMPVSTRSRTASKPKARTMSAEKRERLSAAMVLSHAKRRADKAKADKAKAKQQKDGKTAAPVES